MLAEPLQTGSFAQRRLPRRVGVVAFATIGAVVLAGCGGSGNAKANAKSSLTGAPVKLMTIHEQSAGTASPDIYEGAKAAVDAINAAGGIKGHPVEIINCDTRNDPNTAAACARQAVSDKVLAVVSSLTPYGDQVMPILAAGKIPDVGIVPGAGPDFTSPVSFPITGGAPAGFAGLGRALANAGSTRIALARIDVPQAAALSQFVTAGLTGMNAKVIADVKVPPGAPDMSTYAAAATANGANGIVVGVSGQDAINLIQAIRQANPKVTIAFVSTEPGQVITSLGATADGLLQSESETDLINTPAIQQFKADMKAADLTGPAGFRLNAWLSVQIVKKFANHLSSLTSTALLNALNSATAIDTGVIPPLQFTKAPIPQLPRVFNLCVITTVIKNGQETIPSGSPGYMNPYSGQSCTQPS